ncbi:MAG TPA: histidine phosphatase family protein [Steroidobacteraceae bacterium]
MRELILLRHGQAEPAGIDAPDVDRPLTLRGREEAQRTALSLQGAGLVPELILLSPALRARETAEQLCATMRIGADRVREIAALYLATPQVIRFHLQSVPEYVRRLLLIGHNPGLSDLATQLASNSSGVNLPSAGFARIPVGGTWHSLGAP